MKTLKIAFRNLLKNKLVSTINLLGLTLGIVVSLLLLAYVEEEKNTDTFLPYYSQINTLTINGDPYISKPMVAVVKNSMPNIPITYFGANWAKQVYLSDEHKHSYKIANLLDADSSFFQVFDFEILYGDTQKNFGASNKIVLSEDLSRKIFGKTNPVGKVLNYNTSDLNNEIVEVVAVLKKMPANTSWKFDAVLSIQTNDKIAWYKYNADRWNSQNYTACCRLLPNMKYIDIDSRLKILSKEYKKGANNKVVKRFGLKPYADNYFSKIRPEIFKHGNVRTITVLQLIALLILLMATINYVNLVSAQRQKRQKSVAIIKMLGSKNWGVVQLFMSEAMLLILGVLILFTISAKYAVQLLNNLFDTNFSSSLMFSPTSLLLLMAIVLFTFVVTGVIPGIIFSRHQALQLINPNATTPKKSLLRNILPITQFAISIILIICMFAIKKQNNMMLNQNPGFQKKHIVFASTNRDIKKNIEAFTNKLKAIVGISDITFAEDPLGNVIQHWIVDYAYKGEKNELNFNKIGVSENFFDFFGIQLKRGKFFSKNVTSPQLILNENCANKYGFKDLDDIKIKAYKGAKVIGVVEDINFASAHTNIMPLIFVYEGKTNDNVFVKLDTKNFAQTKQTLAQIEQIWNKISPNLPFEYQFLDESWDNLYKKEVQFQNILNYAGLISIIIAVLGLFGLSMFVAERRTKEIGIRKINGASLKEILVLLNSSFVKWVVVAFVIATPIAYYAMSKWLESFAYKTTLSWWIFALAGLSALVIALLTVSWQSWRTANRNPVEALRYE